MKQRVYLAKELALLVLVLGLVFLLTYAILTIPRKEDDVRHPPERGDDAEFPAVSIERSLRDAFETRITARAHVLRGEPVNTALEGIRERLLSAAEKKENLPYGVDILVIDADTAGAVALPGGLVVVYTGLVQQLDTAEQMAGVLAHELGHVVHRDSVKQLARQLGISALLSLVGGPKSAALMKRIMEQALHIRHARQAEARADRFALDVLHAAGIDPAHFALALERLKREPQDERIQRFLRYTDTHPAIDERIRLAREYASRQVTDTVQLDVEWDRVQRSLR